MEITKSGRSPDATNASEPSTKLTERKRSWVPPRSVVRAVMALRRALLQVADSLAPPLALFDLASGFWRCHMVGVFVQLGLDQHLTNGPMTAAELASRAGVDAGALHRALRSATVFGLVRLDPTGRFHATRITRVLATEPAMRAWAQHLVSKPHLNAWGDVAETIRTGKNAFQRVHGMSMWEWSAKHPEEGRTFNTFMRKATEAEAPAILASYPFPTAGTICDVGGGTGALLGCVLKAQPALRGVLVETPQVLAEAAEHLASIGVAERTELVEGNIFDTMPAQADLYLLKHVLHDWGDEVCRRILGTLAATMPPRARLVIIEAVIERNQMPPTFTAFSDVEMMVMSEQGRERSVGEFHSLLRSVGLIPTTVKRTVTGLALIEAVPFVVEPAG